MKFQIVFNPSGTASQSLEIMWPVEARSAAISNGYFTCCINRVGTEVYSNPLTSDNAVAPNKKSSKFFGTTFITAPDGTRTPGLSRTGDGILIGELDLNVCRQTRDKWNFPVSKSIPYSKRA